MTHDVFWFECGHTHTHTANNHDPRRAYHDFYMQIHLIFRLGRGSKITSLDTELTVDAAKVNDDNASLRSNSSQQAPPVVKDGVVNEKTLDGVDNLSFTQDESSQL